MFTVQMHPSYLFITKIKNQTTPTTKNHRTLHYQGVWTWIARGACPRPPLLVLQITSFEPFWPCAKRKFFQIHPTTQTGQKTACCSWITWSKTHLAWCVFGGLRGFNSQKKGKCVSKLWSNVSTRNRSNKINILYIYIYFSLIINMS